METRFLGCRFRRPDRRVIQGLRLPEGEVVFVLDRLRLVDGHPMSYQRSFLPASIGREAAKADLAVTLGSREARELGYPAGTPAFRSERDSWGAAGAPVVFDRVLIPGDRFRITRELQYDGAPP